MITIGNLVIIMTLSTGFLRAVRKVTFESERFSVEILKDDSIMEEILRENLSRCEEE